MTVDQLPGQVREFANYLDGLVTRLDQGGGWCAVFWQRDPGGMRACLDGREVPPWDVVEALLQDLAAEYGPGVAGPEKEQARSLHAAALLAYDATLGGRDALGDRLDVMLREQRYAAERLAELGRLLHTATTRQDADAIRMDLAWARDDHERATARCAELRSRMEELERRAVGGQMHGGQAIRPRNAGEGPVLHAGSDPYGSQTPTRPRPAPSPYPTSGHPAPYSVSGHPAPAPSAQPTGFAPAAAAPHSAPAPQPTPFDQTPTTPAAPAPAPPDPHPTPKQRKRRRGSARFAGMAEEEATPSVVPPEAPAPAAASGRTPRGARFAGAAAEPAERSQPQAEPLDAAARRETTGIVETLVRLRGEGRSGEAHVLLVEAAYWPAARFPLLAAEMERAGLGADWATLLWEAASLPADRLVAAADALVAAGRTADGEQMLRQGVARPAAEIGRSVLALAIEGRRREVRALLDAYVRVRTPEEAARSAEPDPQTLVPLLLEAAQGVSDDRHWDLVHALRVAGLTS
ncbi:hypothetical protein ACFV7R_04080 [Streptomyces sp. NPDC059866]|uniref:hypothetical protein n=1 Tax=Streptomyces sp. NPDC059866 TaxID=3346978 RepID=UPI0036487130